MFYRQCWVKSFDFWLHFCIIRTVTCLSFFRLIFGLIAKVALILERKKYMVHWFLFEICCCYEMFITHFLCLSQSVYVFFCYFQLARQKIIRNHELVGRARLIVWFHYKITLKTVFDPWLTCAIGMFMILI